MIVSVGDRIGTAGGRVGLSNDASGGARRYRFLDDNFLLTSK